MPDKYLILNVRDSRRGEELLWWRENRNGYTSDIKAAGRYALEDAENIAYCEGDGSWGSRGRHDIAIPESVALKLPSSTVVHSSEAIDLAKRFPAKHRARNLVDEPA